jgi:hypothetical protein
MLINFFIRIPPIEMFQADFTLVVAEEQWIGR